MLNRILLLVLILMAIFPNAVSLRAQQSGYRLERGGTYVIIAPRKVRPNMPYQLHVSLKKMMTTSEVKVRVSLSRDGEEYAAATEIYTQVGTRRLQMLVPEVLQNGTHQLAVEGVTSIGPGHVLFRNVTELQFDSKYVSMFIQTDRPVYCQDQLVTFRIVALTPEKLTPVSGTITIYVKDAKGIIVWRFLTQQFNMGVFTSSFMLSYPFNEGTWTLSVDGFGHVYEETFRAEFFYVRMFEVNVTMPWFVLETEWGIIGNFFGEHRSSIVGAGDAKLELRARNQQGEYQPGNITRQMGYTHHQHVTFSFSMDELREVWGSKLAGLEMVVEVWFKDWNYLNIQNGTASTWILGDGIRVRRLGRREQSFKPLVPFTAYFAIERTDGSPYDGSLYRAVSVQLVQEGEGTIVVPEDKRIIPDDNIIRITVVPRKGDVKISIRVWHYLNTDIKDDVIAYRYFSPHNYYLSISTSTEQPQVDKYMVFTLRTNTYVEEINYMILAGGNILHVDIIRMKSNQKTFSVAVSREMSPTAKLVVYFVKDTEVVSDVINFYVTDSRLMSATIQDNRGKDFSGDTMELIGRGDPGGYLVLTGHDHEWWARGAATFITKEDVIEELSTYDEPYQQPYQHMWHYQDKRWESSVFFPSSTSGMDTLTSFEMAGLYIFSDMNLTFYDEPVLCNETLGFGRCPSGQCYILSKRCDGIIDCNDGYDEVACWGERPSLRRPDWIRSLHRMNRYYQDALWAWKSSYIMPNGRTEVILDVPKATDPWVISGFVIHPEQGLSLVQHVIQYDTTRIFFLGMDMPTTSRRGEQIGIECSVFNNHDERIEVLVMLHGGEDYRFVDVETTGIVSSYAPRTRAGDIQTMVELHSGETKYVHFPIVPIIETGDIEIKISAYSFLRKDSESMTLSISYDGYTNGDHTPYLIDLVNQGSVIIPDFDVAIPSQWQMPNTQYRMYIPGSPHVVVSLFGDVVSPGFIEDYLTTDNVIGIPDESAEGYTFDLAVNLQTLRYLQPTNQLGREATEKALYYMKTILMRQYAYLQPDGSFKMFRRTEKSCLWLTSYSAYWLHIGLASEWSEDLYIDVNIVNHIAEWIVDQQQEDGSFQETTDQLYDRNMDPMSTDRNGETHKWYVALTAHVTITLSSLSRLTGEAKGRVDLARSRSAEYLYNKLSQITDSYQMAILAYAMHMANHRARNEAFSRLKKMRRKSDSTYWANTEIPANPTKWIENTYLLQPRPYYYNLGNAVSATSYALRLYIARNQLREGTTIMKWLQTQRNSLMGFASTQDTLLALEALTDFALTETNRFIYQMEVFVYATLSPQWNNTFRFDSSNFIDYREDSPPRPHGQVRAYAKGTGYALLQLDTERNVERDFQVDNPDYTAFEIDYDVTTYGRNASHFNMTVCARFILPEVVDKLGMTVVYVDIPTGYVINREIQERIYSQDIPGLKRVRFRDQTLYVFWESMGQDWQCFQFHLERWYPVANTSTTHGIGVFEYSELGMFWDTVYTTWTLHLLHICQVCGSFQCPYCPHYNTGTTTHMASAPVLYIPLLLAATAIYQYLLQIRTSHTKTKFI